MEVTNELVNGWNPQIYKIAKGLKLENCELEDVCQELRMVFVRIARRFDATRGVDFHTYLYRGLYNTAATLIHKQKQIELNAVRNELVNQCLTSQIDHFDYVQTEIDSYIQMADLSFDAKFYLEKTLDGYRRGELMSQVGGPYRWSKLRKELKTKFSFLLEEQND